MPIRVQRKRAKGWKMPDNTVYVGRPTVWGNPFPLVSYSAEWAVENFERMLRGDALGDAVIFIYRYAEKVAGSPNALHPYHNIKRVREELRGKNLACWCPLDQPCHADVLLDVANE